jgi:hypothetical protein
LRNRYWICPPALLLMLLAGACRPPQQGPVRLARGVAFTLRSPETGPRFFASQEVVIHQPDGGVQTLLTTVENDGRRLSIVAATPLGMTLFSCQIQGGATGVDVRVPLPSRFDPRLLPALIQLAQWPLEDLRQGLGPGLELSDAGAVRTLRRQGQVILSITRQAPDARTLQVLIPAAGITMDIRTLEDAP